MKKSAILAAAALSAVTLCADDVKVWGKCTLEEPNLKFSKPASVIKLPPVPGNEKAKTYFALRAYPAGSKAVRHNMEKVTPGADGTGHAIAPTEVRARETVFEYGGFGEIKASADLYVAFNIFVPEGVSHEFRMGSRNHTKNKRYVKYFKTKPGWNFICIPVMAPPALSEGDVVKYITITSKSSNDTQGWKLDNLIIWQGKDTVKPSKVDGVSAKKADDKIELSWKAATDNLTIAKYKVYQGSVKNFTCDASSLVGETISLTHAVPLGMRDDYFYRVAAVDCAGNESEASDAVQPAAE